MIQKLFINTPLKFKHENFVHRNRAVSFYNEDSQMKRILNKYDYDLKINRKEERLNENERDNEIQ